MFAGSCSAAVQAVKKLVVFNPFMFHRGCGPSMFLPINEYY